MKINITLQNDEIGQFRKMNDEMVDAFHTSWNYECLVCDRAYGFVWAKLYNAILGHGSMTTEDCTKECNDKMEIEFYTEKEITERQFRDKFFTPYLETLCDKDVIVYDCGTVTIYDNEDGNDKIYVLKESLRPRVLIETSFEKFYYDYAEKFYYDYAAIKEVDYNMTRSRKDGKYELFYYHKEYKTLANSKRFLAV